MMNDTIIFKNGELTMVKTLAEVMNENRQQATRIALFPVPNYNEENEADFSLKSLECNFHITKNCAEYARLVECAYFMGSIKVLNSDIEALDKKEQENGLTAKKHQERKDKQEVLNYFNEILDECYTKEEKAFSNSDKIIKFFSVYFSKDTSCFVNFDGFITFLNNLEANKPNQVLKPLLQKVLNNFAIDKEDTIYNTFRPLNATTTLLDELRAVYYKGRRVKKGKVVKSYDTDGKLVRLEIALSIIEHLQNYSREKYEQERALQDKEEADAKKTAEQRKAEEKAKAEALAKAKAEQAKKKEQAKEAEEKAKAEALNKKVEEQKKIKK